MRIRLFRWLGSVLLPPPLAGYSWSAEPRVTAQTERRERRWLKLMLRAMTISIVIAVASLLGGMRFLMEENLAVTSFPEAAWLVFCASLAVIAICHHALARHIKRIRSMRGASDQVNEVDDVFANGPLTMNALYNLIKVRDLARERLDELWDDE